MGQSFLLFFAILAACASIGSTLQCFQCSPLNLQDGSCVDPFKTNNAMIKMCESEEVCLKQSTPRMSIDGHDVPSLTIRTCASKSACQNEPAEVRENCYTCSNDLCNSTVKVIPSLSTFIVLYIIKLFLL